MLKTKGKSTIVVSSSGGNKWLQKLSFFSASFIKVDILQLPIVNKSYNLNHAFGVDFTIIHDICHIYIKFIKKNQIL